MNQLQNGTNCNRTGIYVYRINVGSTKAPTKCSTKVPTKSPTVAPAPTKCGLLGWSIYCPRTLWMAETLVWSLPYARLMLLVWPRGIVVYDFDLTFKTCALPTQRSVRILYRDVSRPSWLEMYISIEQRELMIEKAASNLQFS
jgi:hypothetical protein